MAAAHCGSAAVFGGPEGSRAVPDGLVGGTSAFIRKLLSQGATYRFMEEASHLRARFDGGWAVCLLVAANMREGLRVTGSQR